MGLDLAEGYTSLREQRRAGILALAWELGRAPLQREIADFLGVSRSYAASLVNDPDGELERTRKARYAGTCDTCGGPTDGSNGREKAPKRCLSCLIGADDRPPRPRPQPRRVWDEQKCLDAIVRWVERHERIPRTVDLVYAEPGERPCFGTIIRHCYRYVQHEDRYRDFSPEQRLQPYYARGEPTGEWRTRKWTQLTWSLPDILAELAPRLPVAAIMTARNAWVRARLFEVVGVEKIVTTAGERVATDDFGTLWRVVGAAWPEPVVMVQVLNSTPEPDGSFRDYFLRVPPDTETPRQGVAWTFAVEADEYELAVQT